MAAPLPQPSSIPTREEELAARTLHDVANLVTSMLVTASAAAEDIDIARDSAQHDSDLSELLGSAQESLFLLEHAGRLAAHVLRARPLLPRDDTSPANCIGSGLLADLPAVLDLASRAAAPIVARRCPIRIEPGSVSKVVGNDRDLAMVFFNLFINSYEAIGPDGAGSGRIDVSLHQTLEHVCVQIRDSGPGMTGEQLQNAFRPGYSSRCGRGLGLTICLEIVERYGGDIKLANGDGLVVFVFLKSAPI